MKAFLDHVGIAISDLPAALAFYRDALGLEVEASEEVTSQRVRAHFIRTGQSALELLEATASDSPISRYIEKRGPGLHHITLRVDDIHAALVQLKGRGVRLIDERPRPGAEHALVAFIHPSSAHGVLVELKQAQLPSTSLRIQRFTLGDLELTALYDGTYRLDGGTVFGMVPRTIWETRLPPDEHHRVMLAVRPMLVRGTRTMLIDAGLGTVLSEKSLERYGVDRSQTLDEALSQASVSPESIDIVLATHLHFDHAGGFTIRDVTGRIRPRFPRARYVVRRGEWETAAQPSDRSRDAYFPDHFVPLAEAGVLDLVDDDQTIMPGVRVQRTGGHTMHHQMVWIESGGKQAAYCGDLIPTAAHSRDQWIGSIDMYPMDTLAAKKAVTAAAIARNTLVFFPHDPAMIAGFITEHHGKRDVQSPS